MLAMCDQADDVAGKHLHLWGASLPSWRLQVADPETIDWFCEAFPTYPLRAGHKEMDWEGARRGGVTQYGVLTVYPPPL